MIPNFKKIKHITTRFHGTGKFYIEWCEPTLAAIDFSETGDLENQALKNRPQKQSVGRKFYEKNSKITAMID